MKTTSIVAVIAAGIIASSILAYSVSRTEYTGSFLPQGPLNENSLQKEIGNKGVIAFAEQDLTLPEIFERTDKSVVQITTSHESDASDSGLGSGFVYDSNGYIVTNNHVVTPGDSLAVTFSDGTVYAAKLVGSDPYTDLAVLSVQGAPQSKFIPLPIADSTKLRVGEQVVAIGNPFGLSGSMTTGIVSGLGRLLPANLSGSNEGNSYSIPDVIQTDAAINLGNSGGPLLNMRGEVIGINTSIYSTTGEFAGVGFAVPSKTIMKVVPSLVESGSFRHPWLGVTGTNMTPGIANALGLEEPRGFLVTGVSQDGPAFKAGIKGGDRQVGIDGRQIPLGGDIIIEIDGKEVRNIEDILVYLQREKSAGDPVDLTVLRDGETLVVKATLGARPEITVFP